FTGSIVLGCANIAPATCTFDPASIAPGQSATLTVGNLGAVTSESLNFTVTGTVSTSNQLAATSTTTSGSSTTSSGTTMATLALSVQFADFTLAASPTDDSIQAGGTAKYTLTLNPANGFGMPVSLACSGAPAASTCSFSSSTVNVGPSGPATVTLAVHTTSRSIVTPPPDGWPTPQQGLHVRWFMPWAWCILLGLLLVLGWTRSRELSLATAIRNASVTVLLCLMASACGGGGGGGGASPAPNNGTPAGTYTLTVTATAQSLSHKTQVTLKVE
ncbi:MAG: hypothetical protein P8Z30_04535, partial [Acidobacteriota bacterium]